MADQSSQTGSVTPEQNCSAHTVYGLRLDSTRPIPGVPRASCKGSADVFVSLEGIPSRFDVPPDSMGVPWYTSPYQDKSGQPTVILWCLEDGAFLLLRYLDGTRFVVDRAGSKVWAQWPFTRTLDDTFVYLLGPVLGFVLRLRGVLCLHASVVAVDNYAFALIGPGGAGKSTTAAAMATRGFRVCTDDVAPIVPDRNGFRVESGYSRIRLWPSSSSILFGDDNHLPRLVHNWEKRYLDLDQPGFAFEAAPCPLAAIYFLEKRTNSDQAPHLEEISPKEALLALVANTYANYALAADQRAQEFEFLGELMTTVNLRKIVPHSDPNRLETMCRMIVDNFRALLPLGTRA